MKKVKCIVVACLLVLCFCLFTGCGNKDKNNNGSSADLQSTAGAENGTDSQSGHYDDRIENTSGNEGVLEPVITDAATEIEKIVTDAATEAKEAVTGATTATENNLTR